MLIKVKRKLRHPDAPQRHENHRRPMTRRELIAQGFMTGGAAVLTTGLFSLFANPRTALAQLAEDLAADANLLGCGVDRAGTKIPFICIDLAGGANLAGSNVLVGRGGSSASSTYCRRRATASSACPATRSRASPKRPQARPARATAIHADTSLGLAFHSDSAFLRGMYQSFKTAGIAREHQRRRDPAPAPRTTRATIRTTRCTASSVRAPRARSSR